MKSYEKSQLFAVVCNVLKDVYTQVCTDQVNLKRDIETIKSRLEHEGVSFLTLTLPAFGADIFMSIEKGQIEQSVFQGWKKNRRIPAFLQGIVSLVFCVDTGSLLKEPDITAIEGIRMITSIFKKILLPCSDERQTQAIEGFLNNEQMLSTTTHVSDHHDRFCEISDLLWHEVMDEFSIHDLIPRHGPGATADKLYGNQKFMQKRWTERLEPFFPMVSHLMVNENQLDDATDGIDKFTVDQEHEELPVKVTLVPKTLKAPRIIAIEPTCMQYAQQALSRFIIKRLETSKLTAGHINFKDQTINQKLAMRSSVTKDLATIDLSDASDRVPLKFVIDMLKSVPDLRDATLACRSGNARISYKNEDIILNLKKFASMGSALCFPIQAMYYFTIILTALLEQHKGPVTRKALYKASRLVYVYGDDIIVPTDKVQVILEYLADYYCKVNVLKSYWKSNFRESCGMDVYDGREVTPIYVRRLPPEDKCSVQEIISWISTSNQFYKRGYWHTSQFMKDVVESKIGKLPIVQETSPGLGWIAFQRSNDYEFGRWNKRLHRHEVLTYVISSCRKKDQLDGYPALLKVLLQLEGRIAKSPQTEKTHLEMSTRSGTVKLKRRWTTQY